MSEPKPLSRQFDDAAQFYDEVRSGYPEEIIEHIIAFAALPAQGRVFEVGCGTGQITLPFAQRGYTVVALVWRLDRSQGSAFWQATAPIYDTYNPQTSSGNLPLETKVDLYRQALRTSRQFVGMHEISKASTKRFSGEEYLKLLQTFSDHRAMPEPNQSLFFEAISQVIVQMGGEVIRDYEIVALLAKKG
jgi:SAM-dependent methyltransferase